MKTEIIISGAAILLVTSAISGPVFATPAAPVPSAAAVSAPGPAQVPPSARLPKDVGGAQMTDTKTIVENAASSKDHTTLVSLIKAAGLTDTLAGPGPFTVFAPTNEAFDKFPPGAVKDLMKPDNKIKLTKILNYHVVAGVHDAQSIMEDIKRGGGEAILNPVAGGSLKATSDGRAITITDDNNNKATVLISDVYQSNGIVHVTDTAFIPK